MNATNKPAYFKPLSHKRIIRIFLEELSNCYEKPAEIDSRNELLALVELLK